MNRTAQPERGAPGSLLPRRHSSGALAIASPSSESGRQAPPSCIPFAPFDEMWARAAQVSRDRGRGVDLTGIGDDTQAGVVAHCPDSPPRTSQRKAKGSSMFETREPPSQGPWPGNGPDRASSDGPTSHASDSPRPLPAKDAQ